MKGAPQPVSWTESFGLCAKSFGLCAEYIGLCPARRLGGFFIVIRKLKFIPIAAAVRGYRGREGGEGGGMDRRGWKLKVVRRTLQNSLLAIGEKRLRSEFGAKCERKLSKLAQWRKTEVRRCENAVKMLGISGNQQLRIHIDHTFAQWHMGTWTQNGAHLHVYVCIYIYI